MRKRFEQQTTLGILPVADVKINTKSRDELPPVLVALQQIFITPELNEKIFLLLEAKITGMKKKTGRPGMDLWHILVLAIVRHTLNTNWDRMEYLSNNDKTLRKIMGVHVEKFGIEEMEFAYQTIVDNVSLIEEDMLYEINDIVVAYGQKLLKKKEEAVILQLKTDSFAAETNIHFPTDLNLLYDSLRKGIETVGHLCKQDKTIKGWRKHKSIISDIKSLFRIASHKVFKGRNETEKIQSVKDYLGRARFINKRLMAVKSAGGSVTTLMALQQYIDYIAKFINQVERRLLKGEVIPADEKIFSIFEPHTEWISKGKLNKKVELGHLVLITTDQHSFIVDYKVMERQKDAQQVNDLANRIKTKFSNAVVSSHSFDKGFWSKENFAILEQQEIATAVLPKRGRHTKEDTKRESDPGYKLLRRKHSAVESNINMLEHHGLNRCPDKGLKQYKNYVGLSVLAYNLHQLGNKIVAKQRKEEEKNLNRKARLIKIAA
jgi:IS5 family transposase